MMTLVFIHINIIHGFSISICHFSYFDKLYSSIIASGSLFAHCFDFNHFIILFEANLDNLIEFFLYSVWEIFEKFPY